jgi:hypothetical protein
VARSDVRKSIGSKAAVDRNAKPLELDGPRRERVIAATSITTNVG